MIILYWFILGVACWGVLAGATLAVVSPNGFPGVLLCFTSLAIALTALQAAKSRR